MVLSTSKLCNILKLQGFSFSTRMPHNGMKNAYPNSTAPFMTTAEKTVWENIIHE